MISYEFSKAVARKVLSGLQGSAPEKSVPSQSDQEYIASLVSYMRIDNGGGGACHRVSEAVQELFGWPRISGSYLDPEGQVICAEGHVWNVLPDGSWLDPTRDQFGEREARWIVTPEDSDYARYRFAFEEEFNPSTAEFARDFPDFVNVDKWEYDRVGEERAKEALGAYWWLKGDLQMMEKYLRENAICTVIKDISDTSDYDALEILGNSHPSLANLLRQASADYSEIVSFDDLCLPWNLEMLPTLVRLGGQQLEAIINDEGYKKGRNPLIDQAVSTFWTQNEMLFQSEKAPTFGLS